MSAPVVLIVAQGFKESFAATEFASSCAGAARAVGAEPRTLLASDGGEGLLDALERKFTCKTHYGVTGPLGGKVSVPVGWLDGVTAVLETRLACGLALVPEDRRDPLRATTRGVGEVVDQLAWAGASTIYLGLGGSATMDGGMGMARAWGWIPRGPDGVELPDGGGSLAELNDLLKGRRPPARLVGLADVRNPMPGPTGASVYAPQKGASPSDQEVLTLGLDRLASAADRLGHGELASRAGAGAAGGMGFGILFFGGGALEPGAPWVLERVGFDDLLERCAAVVTGEGCFDGTSWQGKLTGEVVIRARRRGVPTVLLAPRVEASVDGPGLVVESGGGEWDRAELARRAASGLKRALGC